MASGNKHKKLTTRTRLRRIRQGHEPFDFGSNGKKFNILVISDIHLGEYSKEHERIDYIKHSYNLDRELCEFLEYYSNKRIEGKPWRLVINGDLVDFLAVTFRPSRR